jgi:hypothetical protein
VGLAVDRLHTELETERSKGLYGDCLGDDSKKLTITASCREITPPAIQNR